MTTKKKLKGTKQNVKNTKHMPQEPQSEHSDDQSDQSKESDIDSSSDGSDGEEEQSSEESDDEEDDQSSEGSDSEEDDHLSEETDEDQSSEGSEDDEEEDQSSEGSEDDEEEDQSSEGSEDDEEEDQSSEGSEDDEEEDQSSEGSDSEEDEQTTDEEESDPNREQDSESEDEDGDGESSEDSSSEPEQQGPKERQSQRSGQRLRQNPKESRRKNNQTQQHKRSSSKHQKSKRKTPCPANPAKLGKRYDIPKQKGTPPQSTKEAKKPPTPKTSRDARGEKVKAKRAGKPDRKEERTTKKPKSEAECEKAESPDSDTKKAGQREKKDRAKTVRGHGYRGTDTYHKRRSQENRRNKLEKQESFRTCPDDQERHSTQQDHGERTPARREEPRFSPVRDGLHQGRNPQKGARRENKTKDIWLNSAGQVCRDRYAGRTFPPDGQPKNAHKKRYSDKCGKELHAYDLVEILAREEDFESSMLQVIRERNVNPDDVQTVLNNHGNIFHIKSDRFCLKLRLKLCAEHSSSNGCENRIYCVGLHICQNFLKGICKYKVCNLGHKLATGHNKKVLGNLFLDRLGDDTLLRVLSKSLPKSTSNSQKGSGDQRTRHSSPNRAFLETSESDAYSLNGDDDSDADHFCGRSKRKKPSPIKKKKQNQTVWSTDSNGDVEIPEICYNSVESSCPRQDEGCEKLHSFQHFYWQISKDNSKWFNLPPKLVLCLEKSYCDVSQDGVTLPRLKGVGLQSVHIDAVKILSRDEWTSDFQSMTLKNSNHNVQLHLRRLCSEKTDSANVKANTFCWYFRDDNDKWISYDNSEEQGQCNKATSENIEKHYLAKPSTPFSLRSQKFNYVLDFQRMCQVNVITNKRREISRRPLGHLQDTSDPPFLTDSPNQDLLPSDWEAMQPKERMRLVDLDPKSDEYNKVITLLKDDTYKAKVKKIQRNQNPYLWKAFQLRKEDMITQYGDEASVKMTDLFHGTNPDIVRNICKENFDFRLHGKSTGHIWGKGSYFGNDITFCYRYCRPDSNRLRYLFVAKVLVGTITVGAKDLERPPLNPATNELFDTTVDNESQPNIFVKYDKQEYYPHYVMIME
ncbi:uncharacterized protein [Penaeus vannamei]|uniref:uncharacterized protein n=1 Tax=Penaeus vannamei TaxID=6689 RepID=UPI00387FABBE